MLTSCHRGLITPFGTLKAGDYWLRQGCWSEVTAAFIFQMGSMETTHSSMQSSLLIQVAWQLKTPIFILSVIYSSPDEAKRAQAAIMAAHSKLDALSCNSRLQLSTASFHTREGCPETCTHTPQQMGPRTSPEPSEVAVVWLWRKALLWRALRGRHWSKALWIVSFLCCPNPPAVPPAHHRNTEHDNLHVEHLDPMGNRSVSSCPQDIYRDWSLGCPQSVFVQHPAQQRVGQEGGQSCALW